MSRTLIVALILLLLSFLAGAYAYTRLPERVASHWNAQGQADGYTTRFWGAFLLPIVTAGLLLLLLGLPRTDPLKANFPAFRAQYEVFVTLFVGFMFYIHVLTILINLGVGLDILRWMSPVFGVLFFYIGVLVEKAKRNWFVGIRTPWTLSSDRVWDKTHALGGKLFKVSGLLAFLGVLFPKLGLFFVLVTAILAALITTVYSYIEFQREARGL